MSTIKLKNKVIDKLRTLDDYVLEEILALIEFETESGIYKTSEAEKLSIKRGLEQIKNGELLTNEEVEKESDSWLKE